MIGVLFQLAYYHYAVVVWLVVFAWMIMAGIFEMLHQRHRMAGSWFRFLGILSLLAVLNGVIFGSYNYWTHLYQYWSIDQNAEYTNVLPTEPARAIADAGKITFASTARVDTTRALGFKLSRTYCV